MEISLLVISPASMVVSSSKLAIPGTSLLGSPARFLRVLKKEEEEIRMELTNPLKLTPPRGSMLRLGVAGRDLVLKSLINLKNFLVIVRWIRVLAFSHAASPQSALARDESEYLRY